jgi:hypothetical protein
MSPTTSELDTLATNSLKTGRNAAQSLRLGVTVRTTVGPPRFSSSGPLAQRTDAV